MGRPRERYVPHVIEPAAGVDRASLAFLVDAYDEEVVAERPRTVLRLHPRIAPVKAAVPARRQRQRLVEAARRLYEELRRAMPVEYDASAAIGKRYRRQDEIGTPWALTIDHQTLEDGTVTSAIATRRAGTRVRGGRTAAAPRSARRPLDPR